MALDIRSSFKTEDEFLLEMLRSAVWYVIYHEGELGTAHRELAVTKAALARGYTEADLSGVAGNPDFDYEDEEGEPPTTPVESARSWLRAALSSIMYHEKELRQAHEALAVAKAVAMRAGFEFNLAEIEAEQAKKLANQ